VAKFFKIILFAIILYPSYQAQGAENNCPGSNNYFSRILSFINEININSLKDLGEQCRDEIPDLAKTDLSAIQLKIQENFKAEGWSEPLYWLTLYLKNPPAFFKGVWTSESETVKQISESVQLLFKNYKDWPPTIQKHFKCLLLEKAFFAGVTRGKTAGGNSNVALFLEIRSAVKNLEHLKDNRQFWNALANLDSKQLLRPGDVRLLTSSIPTTPLTIRTFSESNSKIHFEKHSKEFGTKTVDEYKSHAQRFAKEPCPESDCITIALEERTIRVNFNTKQFLVVNSERSQFITYFMLEGKDTTQNVHHVLALLSPDTSARDLEYRNAFKLTRRR